MSELDLLVEEIRKRGLNQDWSKLNIISGNARSGMSYYSLRLTGFKNKERG